VALYNRLRLFLLVGFLLLLVLLNGYLLLLPSLEEELLLVLVAPNILNGVDADADRIKSLCVFLLLLRVKAHIRSSKEETHALKHGKKEAIQQKFIILINNKEIKIREKPTLYQTVDGHQIPSKRHVPMGFCCSNLGKIFTFCAF